MGARRPSRPWTWGAAAGVVSAGVFLAIAELAALPGPRGGSPILAVGGFVVDVVPRPLKELAITAFGEHDKLVLLAGLALAVVVAAAIAGVLQLTAPPLGIVALAIAGTISLATILTRAGATGLSAVPPLAGAIGGCLTIALLASRLRRWVASASGTEGEDAGALDRRSFFRATGIAAAGAVLVGIGARVADTASASVASIRGALRLPPARTVVSMPAGAELGIEGLSPLFTPNADFYRVDTALTVPTIDPEQWRLVVDGRVDRRVELSFRELVAMGLDEYAITLTCVSNEVGGDLVGNALWQGVAVRDVLALAGPRPGADMVLSRSVDGFTASTPLASLTDDGLDAILAVAMNGEPLPLEHGFPVRMVVPGLYGYVSATKWLTGLTVTTFDDDEAYWTPRGYSARAPIKLSSRIDTPRSGTPVPAGTTAVAGVAWAQTVGIERVEVRIDDGDWRTATLSAPVGTDTWVQWFVDWDAVPGSHYITVRAIDRNGERQIEERAPVAPDGSTGWQRTLITVR